MTTVADLITTLAAKLSATATPLRLSEGAQRLRSVRASRGWSQPQMAAALGVAPNHVAMMEQGRRRVTDRTLGQLRALDLHHSATPTTTPRTNK